MTEPSLSICEILGKQYTLGSTRSIQKDVIRLEELVLSQGKTCLLLLEENNGRAQQAQEDWVHLAEQVPSLLARCLPLLTSVQKKGDLFLFIFYPSILINYSLTSFCPYLNLIVCAYI